MHVCYTEYSVMLYIQIIITVSIAVCINSEFSLTLDTIIYSSLIKYILIVILIHYIN